MYYFYRESNPCFVNCPLYGVCPYLGVSVMRGFTVIPIPLLWTQPCMSHLPMAIMDLTFQVHRIIPTP